MGTVRTRAIVSGRVQGVGFRWSAASEARSLGLSGFVRNRQDGSVEVEAEGADDAVSTFTRWLSSGPPGADVTSVDAETVAPTGGPGFEIR
jgi:acylphosphatase